MLAKCNIKWFNKAVKQLGKKKGKKAHCEAVHILILPPDPRVAIEQVCTINPTDKKLYFGVRWLCCNLECLKSRANPQTRGADAPQVRTLQAVGENSISSTMTERRWISQLVCTQNELVLQATHF